MSLGTAELVMHCWKRRISLVLLMAAASGCGDHEADLAPNHRDAIVGGRRASAAGILGTVAVAGSERDQYCTGTLIGVATVVTAAHCLALQQGDAGIVQLAPSNLLVMAGALEFSSASDSQFYDVSRVVVHPDYVGMPAAGGAEPLLPVHDIGIVLLRRPVTGLQPVRIAASDEPTPMLLIAGYGESAPGVAASELVVADVLAGARTATEFVAGSKDGADSCDRDSGGPAYTAPGEPLLAGIASRALRPDEPCGGGGIYTFAPAYADWLREVSVGAQPTTGTACSFGGGGASWQRAVLIATGAALASRRERKRRRAQTSSKSTSSSRMVGSLTVKGEH
jgi:secreted trypsin-like serine protease